MIGQNRDRPNLQRRQKVTVLLLRRTDSNKDPVTWHDFFFAQFERQKINESIQPRIRQDSVAREAPVDQRRDAWLELGSFSERLNKIHLSIKAHRKPSGKCLPRWNCLNPELLLESSLLLVIRQAPTGLNANKRIQITPDRKIRGI